MVYWLPCQREERGVILTRACLQRDFLFPPLPNPEGFSSRGFCTGGSFEDFWIWTEQVVLILTSSSTKLELYTTPREVCLALVPGGAKPRGASPFLYRGFIFIGVAVVLHYTRPAKPTEDGVLFVYT